VAVPVVRVGESRDGAARGDVDLLAAEEPLEIRIAGRALGVTMRTPGHDEELAAGLLLAEGVVRSIDDIGSIVICRDPDALDLRNVVNVRLAESVRVDWERLKRTMLTNSSCGLCGKASIDALKTRAEPLEGAAGPPVGAKVILELPARLRAGQVVFDSTGGLHAAALFSREGTLEVVREDVGRHNAVDKAIGAALIRRLFPLGERVLLVSGRASYEIVQKAIMARIPVVAAVSAPSSLAVDLAREFGVTLIGFLRDGGFNVYTRDERISV
jgi:FdhD protein